MEKIYKNTDNASVIADDLDPVSAADLAVKKAEDKAYSAHMNLMNVWVIVFGVILVTQVTFLGFGPATVIPAALLGVVLIARFGVSKEKLAASSKKPKRGAGPAHLHDHWDISHGASLHPSSSSYIFKK